MNIIRLISNIIAILLILILFNFLYFNILFPSYLSVINVCNEEKYKKYEDRYFVSGMTSLKPISNITPSNLTGEKIYIIEINIMNNNTKTMKHELIHVRQITNGVFSLSCKNPIQKYFTELEAYTFSYFPNPIFKILYGFDIESIMKKEYSITLNKYY